jgi:acetyltransferase-like isoleucine patch superfamily enzyme
MFKSGWRKVFEKRACWEKNSVIAQGSMPTGIGVNELSFRPIDQGNRVIIGTNVTISNLKIEFKATDSTLILGNDTKLTGNILIVGKGRTVSIGDRTTAKGVYILCRGADVTIGQDCMFSREIEVRSTDVHKIYDMTSGEHLNPARPVVIGDGVWVAARAFISKGAIVPQGSIVGAASFVNRAFDTPNVIIAGSPAKVVKTNVRWKR